MDRPRVVEEVPVAWPPALVHPGWQDRFPWLAQGCTTRGSDEPPFDLGIFSGASSEAHIRRCWEELWESCGMGGAVHARQVHEADVRVHDEARSGLAVEGEFDGHLTDAPGLLLAVTTADCVPVFLVDGESRAVAVLHAGWRGAAAEILERGVQAMASQYGTDPGGIELHLGPSICGACYEVGPEVFVALGLAEPEGPTPIDLRGALAERAVAAGVDPERITVSAHCTRCTGSRLYSHRGGDAQRQVGFIGIRP